MSGKRTVLCLSPLPQQVIEALISTRLDEGNADQVDVTVFQGSDKKKLLESVGNADVIIGDYTNNIEMDAEVIGAAKKTILIQQPSTGYQHIDVEAAAKAGIPVANIAGANTVAVAEHTIMFILGCLKKFLYAQEKTSRGQWAQAEMWPLGIFEFLNKTLGVIGIGRIGKEVVKRARSFGANILYHDVTRLDLEEEKELGIEFVELETLLSASDIVTIHAPLTPETEGLINGDSIAKMKNGAILINVSRGAIVDENALAEAIREGKLAGAGLDVFSEEPIDPDNPILGISNVMLTPHIAGATDESRIRIIQMTINNVANALIGEEIINIVNGVKPAKYLVP